MSHFLRKVNDMSLGVGEVGELQVHAWDVGCRHHRLASERLGFRQDYVQVVDLDIEGHETRTAVRTWANSSPDAAVVHDDLRTGRVDAFAGGRFGLAGALGQVSGARLLTGSFFNAQIGIAAPKGRTVASAFWQNFVNHPVNSGAIQTSINALGGPGFSPGSATAG
jgi:ABC-type amino acid transport substrate-binding protein